MFNDKDMFPISKGKAVPVQAYSGPKGSRRLKLPDFKIIRIRT
jgi:hypothetical protein